MGKQVLNKKMAEWAGFRYINNKLLYPDGTDTFDNLNKPHINFTNSLDACFKWLVPKVLSAGNNSIYLEPHNRIGNEEIYICYKCTIWSDCGGGMKSVSGKDPVLALFWVVDTVRISETILSR